MPKHRGSSLSFYSENQSAISFRDFERLHYVFLGFVAKRLDSGLLSDFLGTVGLKSNDLGTFFFSVFDRDRIFDVSWQ